MGRKTTASWSIWVEVIKRLYGPQVPRYEDSPQNLTPLDDVEIILHELGHLVQFDEFWPLPVYHLDKTQHELSRHLKKLPKDKQDRSEAIAVAAEILVAQALGIPINETDIIKAGSRNTHGYPLQYEAFRSAVWTAKASTEITYQVNAILDIIEMVRKDMHGSPAERDPHPRFPGGGLDEECPTG